MKVSAEGIVRVALIGVVTFLLACMFHGRWTVKDWQLPIEYGVDGPAGDVMGVQFTPIKAASEGNFPLIRSKKLPALGAPYEADWNDFPITEEFHIVVPGFLARWIGVFPALNLFGILGHVTSALGFYLAARLLRYRWEWATAGAIVFGFSLYIFARSLHHLSIGWAGHIPLMIVVARWAFSAPGSKEDGGLLSRNHFGWALAIAIVSGVQHVYYTNMLMQFLGLAVLYQAFHRHWKSAIRAILVGTAAMGAFVVMNLDTLAAKVINGPNPGAVIRSPQYLEFSGFKIADLFIPPPDYWVSSLGAWGNRYFSEVMLKGETPVGSFLGIIGIGALLWLVIAAVRNLAQSAYVRPPWEFLLAAWVALYATVGGLNAWIGSLGFVLFRSSTRYTIFILALALLYAVRRLSALSTAWTMEKRIALASAIAVVALWDQVPRVPNEDPVTIAGFVASDRQFAEEMESRLSPGSMVFQLPVMDFPESPIPGVPSYNHFRPSIYTKTLRYSFGDVKGKARNAWQNEVAFLPPEELMRQLERYGFGALYINRNGYADGGKAYLDAAADRAATVLESPRKDLVCILLRPAATAVLPPPGPHFGKGWGEVQRSNPSLQVRTGSNQSQIVLTNPEKEPIERYLQFVIQGVDEREMTLDYNGLTTPLTLKPGVTMKVENVKVQLKPGRNVLSFDTAKPPIHTGNGPIAFQLINFRMTEGQIQQTQ